MVATPNAAPIPAAVPVGAARLTPYLPESNVKIKKLKLN
jgi:hypothetical protein